MDQHAEATLRADELGDDGADQGEDHGHVEAGHHEGQGIRQPEHPEDLTVTGGQRAHEAHPVLVGRLEPHHGIDEQREERDERRVDDLGREPEAEPHDDERRQRHLGQRLEHHDIGIEEELHPAVHGHGGAQEEPEQRADDEAKERLEQRVAEVVQVEAAREPAVQRQRHLRRRRQDEDRDGEGAHDRLPRAEGPGEDREGDGDVAHVLHRSRFMRRSGPAR